MAQRWQSDCKDQDITVAKANLVLQQAKERLDSTISNSDALDNKTIVLLPVLITLVTALFGFLTTKYDPKIGFFCQDWFLIMPIAVLACSFSYAAWELSGNLKPMNYEPAGKSPINLAQDKFTKLSSALMIFCEAESYQPRITKNDEANKIKAERLSNCLKIVLNGFLITAGLYIVMIYLYSSAGHYHCPR